MTSRWLLRALVVLAVAVMHHVDTEPPAAAECCVVQHHDGGSESGPDALHLCLAVLVGLAVLAATARDRGAVSTPARGRPLPRPPPPARLVGRRTLHTLCVLRL